MYTSYSMVFQVDLHFENDDTLSENQPLILTRLKIA